MQWEREVLNNEGLPKEKEHDFSFKRILQYLRNSQGAVSICVNRQDCPGMVLSIMNKGYQQF